MIIDLQSYHMIVMAPHGLFNMQISPMPVI